MLDLAIILEDVKTLDVRDNLRTEDDEFWFTVVLRVGADLVVIPFTALFILGKRYAGRRFLTPGVHSPAVPTHTPEQ